MDRTKALGFIVLGIALFALYLGLANWFSLLSIASLPLVGRLSSDLVNPLILVSLLGSIMVNKWRRAQSRPNPN